MFVTLRPTAPARTFFAAAVAVLVLASGFAQADRGRSTPLQPATAEATRVHVILLADTQCGNIGTPCAKDVAAFRNQLIAGFADKSDRLAFHDLTMPHPVSRQDWTPPQVLVFLERLAVGPNESVIVYHSGHGAMRDRNDPAAGHQIGINTGPISRRLMRDLIRQKQPRGLILLSDCCSAYVDAARSAPGSEGRLSRTINRATVRNLFLRLIGEVDITAAKDGTNAVAAFRGSNPADAGSAFTVALLRLMFEEQRTFLNWEDFFPALCAETLRASGGAHEARAFLVREEAHTGFWGF